MEGGIFIKRISSLGFLFFLFLLGCDYEISSHGACDCSGISCSTWGVITLSDGDSTIAAGIGATQTFGRLYFGPADTIYITARYAKPWCGSVSATVQLQYPSNTWHSYQNQFIESGFVGSNPGYYFEEKVAIPMQSTAGDYRLSLTASSSRGGTAYYFLYYIVIE